MAKINNLFQTFHDNISLSNNQIDNLRTGRDALRDIIRDWFDDNDKQKPHFCWQGSFAMKTTVSPINGGEYDLDDGVYLSGYSEKEISDWPATSTVHNWIKSAVTGHTKEDPVDKNTCVRVIYTKGYHIDYPIYIEKGDIAYLAHKRDGWIESDPKAFKEWFLEKVQTHGEQLRRLTKYMKAWKDYKEIPLKGIEITILVAENFIEYEGRDEKSLCETVKNILAVLKANFTCKKPVSPYEDLFREVSKTKKDSILSGLETLSTKLDLAVSTDDPKTASEYMIEMFGNRFPMGKEIKKNEGASAFIHTSAPGVLRHDGRSA